MRPKLEMILSFISNQIQIRQIMQTIKNLVTEKITESICQNKIVHIQHDSNSHDVNMLTYELFMRADDSVDHADGTSEFWGIANAEYWRIHIHNAEY